MKTVYVDRLKETTIERDRKPNRWKMIRAWLLLGIVSLLIGSFFLMLFRPKDWTETFIAVPIILIGTIMDLVFLFSFQFEKEERRKEGDPRYQDD